MNPFAMIAMLEAAASAPSPHRTIEYEAEPDYRPPAPTLGGEPDYKLWRKADPVRVQAALSVAQAKRARRNAKRLAARDAGGFKS